MFLQRVLAFTSARLPSGIRPWGLNGLPMEWAQQIHPKASHALPLQGGVQSPHMALCSTPTLHSTKSHGPQEYWLGVECLFLIDSFICSFIHSFMIRDLAV